MQPCCEPKCASTMRRLCCGLTRSKLPGGLVSLTRQRARRIDAVRATRVRMTAPLTPDREYRTLNDCSNNIAIYDITGNLRVGETPHESAHSTCSLGVNKLRSCASKHVPAVKLCRSLCRKGQQRLLQWLTQSLGNFIGSDFLRHSHLHVFHQPQSQAQCWSPGHFHRRSRCSSRPQHQRSILGSTHSFWSTASSAMRTVASS